MRKISTKFFLCSIVVLAFFLRVWRVGEIPPSLSWDEVSIGYNAYSILKTGRDEHGKFFPLDAFAAYGDYKPPLAVYVTVPSIAIFGLNEFAVRFPSVIFGTVTVWVSFYLIFELLKKSNISLLTSFLLAVSPWHLQLSRVGFEANIALFFVVFGAYLVLRSRENTKLLLYCWLPFVAAMYTFNSARYFIPLFSLILFFFYKKEFQKNKNLLLFGIIVALVALFPVIGHLFSKESRLRFAEVNIFSDAGIVETANTRIEEDNISWWSKFVHNRRIGYTQSYLTHFFDHFQPWFLFVRGDGNPKFSLQDVGQLYAIELPFLVLGILWLFRDSRKVAWFATLWIVAAIIPAATARETPHALRIENSLPIWQFFVAYAVAHLAKNRRVAVLIVFLYLMNFSFFWHTYFNHYAKEYSGEWQYGYREAVRYVQSVKYQYDAVVFDDIIGRPYMYALFYDRYDPKKFQDGVDRSIDGAGFYHVAGFDQYRFVDRQPEYKEKMLYVMRPKLVPEDANIQETIRLLNGDPVLVIFDIVPEIQ